MRVSRESSTRALDAFGMIVRDVRHLKRKRLHLVKRIPDPPARAHAHGRSVAPRIVGLRIVAEEPIDKTSAIAAAGNGLREIAHCLSGDLPQVAAYVPPLHERRRNGDGHERIVGPFAVFVEELEFLRLDVVVVEFETRPDNVPDDCAYHLLSFTLIGVWLRTARMSSSLQLNISIAAAYAPSMSFASTSREPTPLINTVHFFTSTTPCVMVPRPEPAKPIHGHGIGEFYWRTSVPLDL